MLTALLVSVFSTTIILSPKSFSILKKPFPEDPLEGGNPVLINGGRWTSQAL